MTPCSVLLKRACAFFALAVSLGVAGKAQAQPPNYNATPSFLQTWTASEYPSQQPLSKDASGNIYGFNTTDIITSGNFSQQAFVFEMANQGNGSFSYRVVYTLPSNYSFFNLAGPAVDSNGNVFGLAFDHNSSKSVLFELVNSGGTYTFQLLYTFVQGVDSPPNQLLIDAAGNLYGASPGVF